MNPKEGPVYWTCLVLTGVAIVAAVLMQPIGDWWLFGLMTAVSLLGFTAGYSMHSSY